MQACYRSLKRYKYQLVSDYIVSISIKPTQVIQTPYVNLSDDGVLSLKKGYAWDGPSGPTIDTPNFMRGSLVHDALYQLMRLKLLDEKLYRKPADQILRRICIEDGMTRFRAWYVYHAVQWFGRKNASMPDQPDMITCVPVLKSK